MSSSDDDTPLVKAKDQGKFSCLRRRKCLFHALRVPSPLQTTRISHRIYSTHFHQVKTSIMGITANRTSSTAISSERISKDEDKAMDKQVPSNGHVEPGISIRMGPVDDMDVDAPATNGNANGKRKARSSITNSKSYKDASSSEEDDKPLVRILVCSL
jgi:hypothetical protein